MRYYLIDHGKEMIETSKQLTDYLSAQGFHYIVYLTDADGLLCCEEIDENEFLDHFKSYKRKK